MCQVKEISYFHTAIWFIQECEGLTKNTYLKASLMLISMLCYFACLVNE